MMVERFCWNSQLSWNIFHFQASVLSSYYFSKNFHGEPISNSFAKPFESLGHFGVLLIFPDEILRQVADLTHPLNISLVKHIWIFERESKLLVDERKKLMLYGAFKTTLLVFM